MMTTNDLVAMATTMIAVIIGLTIIVMVVVLTE